MSQRGKQANADANDLRVLLVDDHDLFRTGLRNLLEEQGVQIVGEASNGLDAIRCVREVAPDVVVMDLNMPGLDGWMSMSLIKARRPKLPVVVLTGDVGKDLESRAKTAGAAGFLTKPCQPDALIRTLKKATSR